MSEQKYILYRWPGPQINYVCYTPTGRETTTNKLSEACKFDTLEEAKHGLEHLLEVYEHKFKIGIIKSIFQPLRGSEESQKSPPRD